MSLRVFDVKDNIWCHGEFCIYANEDLMEIKKRPFGFEKLELLSNERYIWQKDIGLCDSKDNLVFEGDICEMNLPVNPDDPENSEYECSYHIVAYSYENAAYYLVNIDDNSCCRFNKEVIQYITVVNNIFEFEFDDVTNKEG